MYDRNKRKKIIDPIIDCFVETESSLGTGINENMSMILRIRIAKLGCLYLINEASMLILSLESFSSIIDIL